ncbi:unnamed protein product [Phaeothamnion confervicola]
MCLICFLLIPSTFPFKALPIFLGFRGALALMFSAPLFQLRRAQFSQENDDFVFDLAGSAGVTGESGTLQTANAASFPALTGEGIAMARIVLEPCGINIPHVHPRATELQIVIDAGPEGVLTSFVEENNGRTITDTVYAGMVSFFPQGLTHFELNLGCTNATLISAFGDDDFGVQQTSTTALAGLPTEGLAASLGISEDDLAALIASFPTNAAKGSEECRHRCGIA